MKHVLLGLLLLSGCAAGRVIRDSAYPTYVEVSYPDGSKAEGAWMCVRETVLQDDGTKRDDRLICTSAAAWMDMMTGGKPKEGQRIWFAL